MKTAIFLLASVGLFGCAARQSSASLVRPPVFVFTPDDLEARPDLVPVREARQVVAMSFPSATTDCTGSGADAREEAWIESSIYGSFTGPGAAETMYSAQLSRCNDLPSSPKRHFLLIYLGGREVWRTPAPEAVRAVDVDGDHQDEWIEVFSQCNGECVTEAWVQGYVHGTAVTLAHAGM